MKRTIAISERFTDVLHKLMTDSQIDIHAWATHDNIRIVHLIDTGAYFERFETLATGHNRGVVATGQGHSIEVALYDALIRYRNTVSADERSKTRKQKSSTSEDRTLVTSTLDHWLVKHRGEFSASVDEDGHIISHLRGIDPKTASNATYVAKGKTIHEATEAAFKADRLSFDGIIQKSKPAPQPTPQATAPQKKTRPHVSSIKIKARRDMVSRPNLVDPIYTISVK